MKTHRGVVVSRMGAVAASQPLAVSAGIAVLDRGGSFADAAIAMSAVLCVVEPWNSHLGGDAFLVVHDARRGQNLAFNGSGAAPQSATAESYRDGIPLRGFRAATVPGLVSTWFALHRRFGRLPVAKLLLPAIRYAAEGFPAGPRWVRVFSESQALLSDNPSLQALGGTEPQLGKWVVQPDLAETLMRIAAGGRDSFYRGEIARKIVAGSGGHFHADDLAAHQTRVLSPLAAPYRGLLVYGQPPPSQGMILLEELRLAEGFSLAQMDAATRTHVLVEAKRLAFADRNAYLGDPETGPVPTAGLLADGYVAARRALISLEAVRPAVAAGSPPMGSDTTYFLVADQEGNAVSFIQSIFHGFGCAQIADGTGVLFNNRLTGFTLDPTSPNVVAPGKRPAHTLNAWLATDAADGKLALVGGTPGGHVQVQTNLQLLVNAVDLGMDVQQAIEAPRWQHLAADYANDLGVLEIEDRVGEPVIAGLRARGHVVRAIGSWAHGSSAQLLAVLPGGAFAVGSDPRCDGHAAGL